MKIPPRASIIVAAMTAMVHMNSPLYALQTGPTGSRWQRPPAAGCTTSQSIVTLSSNGVLSTVGLAFAQIQESPLEHTIDRNAEVAYNANRFARLSSRAPGVVAEVVKDLGELVKKGDVLAVIDSSELSAAKAMVLQSVETVNLWQANAVRERAMLEKGVGIEREALEAETRLAESKIQLSKARQQLQNLGLSKQQIELVEKEGDTSSVLELTAPFDGTMIDRRVVMGEVVEPGMSLISIADTTTMWAMVDLMESDLAIVRTKNEVTLTLDAFPNRSFTGTLTWISTEVEHKTRTVKARAEFDNEEGFLRANMFGRTQIRAGDSREVLTIQKDAVQWEGCCNIAFVRSSLDELSFQPRKLTLGYDAGDRYEVLHGLEQGISVVTNGSAILKNELLKDDVGAGCCDVSSLDK